MLKGNTQSYCTNIYFFKVMRKVIGMGETMLDIIFKGGRPVEAVPGGSTFNAIVSLGRAGVPCTFFAETGDDRVGAHIRGFLQANGVDTSNVAVTPYGKSPVSLAFLNDRNEADYVFYRDTPHEHLDFDYPDIAPDDIVIVGSFYAVNPAVRPQVQGLLEHARSRGAVIYYDLNYREAHRGDVMRVTPNLIENLEMADIVRGSVDDFGVVYGIGDADKAYNAEISFYCKRLVCTNGPKPVVVFSDGGLRKEYATPDTPTVSTIGAGDNFNAGIVYGMLRDGIRRADLERGLTESQWDSLVGYAQMFAADCCRDIFNYVSPEFGQRLKEKSPCTP